MADYPKVYLFLEDWKRIAFRDDKNTKYKKRHKNTTIVKKCLSFVSDWKPIAPSRDTSYIDYFGLDKSESSFAAVKSPWKGEFPTSTAAEAFDVNSRQERGHPWSSPRPNSAHPRRLKKLLYRR